MLTDSIKNTQAEFFKLYEMTRDRLKHLAPQTLNDLRHNCSELRHSSPLYSERVAAELVFTACDELLKK